MWINASFLLLEDLQANSSGGLEVSFLSLRSSLPLIIEVSPMCDIVIRTDDMDLAGDIIQAIANYLNLEDLQV